MSFSSIALSVVFRIQKLIQFPYSYEPNRGRFSRNSNYNKHEAAFLRCFIGVLTVLSILFHGSLTVSNVLAWKHGEKLDLFSFVVSVIIGLCFVLLSVLAITVHFSHEDLYYSVNSILATESHPKHSRGIQVRKYTPLFYLIAICNSIILVPIYLIPMSPAFSKIFIDFHWVLKAITGLGHGLAMSYLALPFYKFHLILVVFLVKTVEFIKGCIILENPDRSRLRLTMAEMIAHCFCKSVSFYLTTLIFTGVFFASGNLYIVISMVGKVPLTIYNSSLLLFLICLTFAMILTKLGWMHC